ncbi:hypothetical protein SEA_BAUER_85 [Arthrobacter phage Bauer]|uniref:Uncharacterized protein n=1 Tax=Arthrobacter phage Bauer TaxID=2985648 RepID=A0A9E7V2Q7_9CAUD|nr:hypothetical protein QEO99_gp85 [Arthrobacter phage Bauer]UYM26634.1 hypothetical protein SEA_BAUER_85 [Arthrobacter phage Bauer]
MSEEPFDAGGFLHGGKVYVAPRGTEAILTNGQWMHIGYVTAGPRQELMWRLNQTLKGEDPGRPVNWKGLR